MLKARELDPLSMFIARQIAFYYYVKRDAARALQIIKQVNEQGPGFVTIFEPTIYIKNGAYEEALVELEKAKRERKVEPRRFLKLGVTASSTSDRAGARD